MSEQPKVLWSPDWIDYIPSHLGALKIAENGGRVLNNEFTHFSDAVAMANTLNHESTSGFYVPFWCR